MKRFVKYSIFMLAVTVCASLFSGCMGAGWFAFLLLNNCRGCSPKPSSLYELRGVTYAEFSDEEQTFGFRIVNYNYFGGYGYVTVNGEKQHAFYDINGYYGIIDIYTVNEKNDGQTRLFTLKADYEKKEGGITITDTRSSASGEEIDGLFLKMTDITDRSTILPYEYNCGFTDADGFITIAKPIDFYSPPFKTALKGDITVVSAERDRIVPVEVYFYDDYTFEIYEIKIHSTETVSEGSESPAASGTFSYNKEFSYTLHFTEDNLFTEELSRSQFPLYPDIVISK